jgi:hypothetical protein
MKRTTQGLPKDRNQKTPRHITGAGDKDRREPLQGFTPRRRATSPSVPHSKTYGH